MKRAAIATVCTLALLSAWLVVPSKADAGFFFGGLFGGNRTNVIAVNNGGFGGQQVSVVQQRGGFFGFGRRTNVVAVNNGGFGGSGFVNQGFAVRRGQVVVSRGFAQPVFVNRGFSRTVFVNRAPARFVGGGCGGAFLVGY